MKRTDPLLPADMLESIEEIMASRPLNRAQFDADKFRASHLLRHLQIVGETAWRLSDAIKETYPDVPWRQMAGMRHALVHDYFEIDWNRVYETVIRDIDALYPLVKSIIGELPNNASFDDA